MVGQNQEDANLLLASKAISEKLVNDKFKEFKKSFVGLQDQEKDNDKLSRQLRA